MEEGGGGRKGERVFGEGLAQVLAGWSWWGALDVNVKWRVYTQSTLCTHAYAPSTPTTYIHLTP